MSAAPLGAGQDPDFINFPLEREALQFFLALILFFILGLQVTGLPPKLGQKAFGTLAHSVVFVTRCVSALWTILWDK